MGVRRIPLTQGFSALVDDEDYERVCEFKWCAATDRKKGRTYAVRTVDRKTVFLHRAVLGTKAGAVRFRNGNPLDCRRENLIYRTSGSEVGQIQLSNGMVARCDAADWPALSQYVWHATRVRGGGLWYAGRYVHVGPRRRVMMHEDIMGTRPGYRPDHRNRDGLDNRRSNLRWADAAQQCWNRKAPSSVSGYRGVRQHRHRWGWTLTVRGKRWSGTEATPEAAARARDAIARKLHGEFAVLNFPER